MLEAVPPVPDSWLVTLDKILIVVDRVWNYEIKVGTYPLTLSGVVGAVLILFVGLFVSRRLSRWMGRTVRQRAVVDESTAANAEKITYYFLLILVVLLCLHVMDVPLTVFTLFGGAVAIGVGFGAQNIINNFISGLILMIERPIRLNDVVEIDGLRGRIANIGARASQLRLFSGIDLLVPNSAFLEKNVINWTLADKAVRFSVKVGVAYGAPVREVERLISEVVRQHDTILKAPEPVILFTDFGDSALMFEAFFWIEVTATTDPRVACSDIRFRIDEVFREAGIVIAFPQRDVHLDVSQPLPVRIVRPDDTEESGRNIGGTV